MENKEQKDQPEDVNKEDMNQEKIEQEENTVLEDQVTSDDGQETGADNAESDAEQQEAKEEKPLTLEEQLEQNQQQVAELKDKYLRLYAEFDNFRKRSVKEKLDFMKTAAQDTLSALLPVLDDFDRAKKNADSPESTEVFSDGVNLVYQKLYNVLANQGLTPMETNGAEFDPELHEAITEIPAPSKDMKGKVIDTIEKGYKLKDKIIRHAKVVVGA